MAIVWVDGFEHGSASFAAGWDGIFTGTGTVGGTPAASTTRKRMGTYALRINKSSAGNSYAAYAQGTDYSVGQVWVCLEDLPAGEVQLLQAVSTTGSITLRIVCNAAGNIGVKIGADASVYGSSYIVADVFSRIDFRFFCQATTYAVDYRVNGVAATQVTSGGRTATTVANFYLGSTTVADVFDCYYDDLKLSVTSADYPLVASSVYSTLPTGEGTHNPGVNGMEDNAGADINGTTVQAFPLLDAVPDGSTTVYLQQNGTGTGEYVEVTFANRSDPGGAVLAARAYLGLTSSGTAANNGQTYVSDDGFATQDTVYAGAMNPGTTPVRFKSAMLANALDIDNLKARVGFSSDGAPVPRWSLLIVQYAVEDLIRGKANSLIGQAVQRAAVR